MSISVYAKSIVYMVIATASAVIAALADNTFTLFDLVQVLIVFAGTIPVYLIPNLPEGPAKYSKAIAAFVVAGLVAGSNFIAAGAGLTDLTVANWLTVGIAAFAGIGIVIVPNVSAYDAKHA